MMITTSMGRESPILGYILVWQMIYLVGYGLVWIDGTLGYALFGYGLLYTVHHHTKPPIHFWNYSGRVGSARLGSAWTTGTVIIELTQSSWSWNLA